MNDFKVGDVVWFMTQAFTQSFPAKGFVNCEQSRLCVKDSYDDIIAWLDEDNDFYKSKQDCIDAFKKRLDEL